MPPEHAAAPDDYEAFWGPDRDVGGETPAGRRRLVVVASIALSVALLLGVARAAGSGDGLGPEVAVLLHAQADAMVDSGMPEDHPKVVMLRQEADEVADRWGVDRATEADAELRARAESGEVAGSPGEARRRAAAGEAGAGASGSGAGVVSGPLRCEPVPQLLGADEVAGARCLGVPQPDGSTLLLAVTPQGSVHAVAFRAGGGAERLPGATLPAGVDPATAQLVPRPSGEVEVRRGATAVTVLDLS